MLINDLKKLGERAKNLKKARDSRNYSKSYETRKDELKEIQNKLLSLTEKIRSFNKSKITISSKSVTAKNIKITFDELTKKFNEEPSSILPPETNLDSSVKRYLDPMIEQFDDDISSAWKDYCKEKYSDNDRTSLINALKRVSQDSANIKDLQNVRIQIFEKINKVPKDLEQELVNLKELVEKRESHFADLNLENAPESLYPFLKKVGQEGAMVNDLTDELRVWLESTKLLNEFRIKFVDYNNFSGS